MDFLAIRKREISCVQILLATRNAIQAVGMVMPIFSSMLSFITFSLTQHPLDPGPIFSSLALFNQLRLPLNLLPMVIGQIADALSSVNRIEEFLLAEDQPEEIIWDVQSKDAISLENATFTWERTTPDDTKPPLTHRELKWVRMAAEKAKKEAKKAAKRGDPLPPPPPKPEVMEEKEPFKIEDIDLHIGHNEFIGVIGPVGSGKSSLLAAIAGEMRQLSGSINLGAASRSFCPQHSWIQNATVQDNIIFGKPYDRGRYNQVIDSCALRKDFEMLPNGDMTEIGERGINLSGGQKARVNLARAIYFEADIILMDDPLSAVDAHVGRHILEQAMMGPLLRTKCRILATHQLHVLNRCDRIVLMADGRISAMDTFDNLMAHNAEFQRLMAKVDSEQTEEKRIDAEDTEDGALLMKEKSIIKADNPLMQEEERAVKAVKWSIYTEYFRAAGSVLVPVLIIGLLILSQGANIATSLWLAWWTSDNWGFSMGAYVS
jgi:ATP-binding cassette subfamily C (CFTR/MRP) protein 1